MADEKKYSFIIKIKFDERNRNLMGAFLVIGDTWQKKMYVCYPIVNYYSESLAQLINIQDPWLSYAVVLRQEKALLTDAIMLGQIDTLTELFVMHASLRIDTFIHVLSNISNLTLKGKMLKVLIMEILKPVFPYGYLTYDVALETNSMPAEQLLAMTGIEAADMRTINPGIGEAMEAETAAAADEEEKIMPDEDQELVIDEGEYKVVLQPDEIALWKSIREKEKERERLIKKHDQRREKEDEERRKKTEKLKAKELKKKGKQKTGKTNKVETEEVAEVDPKERAWQEEMEKGVSIAWAKIGLNPINGIPAKDLKKNDEVMVFRRRGVKMPGTVLDISNNEVNPDFVIITIDITDRIQVQAELLGTTRVWIKQKETTKKSYSVALSIAFLIVLAIVIAIIISAL